MKKDGKSESSGNLRQNVEELMKRKPENFGSTLDEAEIMNMFHDLKRHKVEFELQNNELLLANARIAAQAEKYVELYDFAPLGYFTLANNGKILELNICGSQIVKKQDVSSLCI